MSEVQIITKEDAQPSPEEIAAATAAGFASVDEDSQATPKPKREREPKAAPEKKEEEAQPDPAAVKAEAEAKAKAEEEASAKAAAEAEWAGVPPKVRQTLEALSGKVSVIDRINQDFKSLAGRTGAALEGVHKLQTAMEQAKADAAKTGAEAPTKEQIADASKSKEAWDALKDEFKEWAAGTEWYVAEQLKKLAPQPAVDAAALKTELAGTTKEMIAQATTQAIAQGRALALVDFKHPGWEDTINTPEFVSWTDAQAPEVQALRTSPKAADAIKMLDLYVEHQRVAAEAAAKEARNKQRLEAAIVPKGSGAAASERQLSEREAMLAGFASVDQR